MTRGARLAAAVACACALASLFAAAPAAAAPGEPDPSFGGTGMRTYQPRGLAEAYASDVLVQPDGKILVLGSAGGYRGRNHDIVVMRLDADGTPDTSFGLGGTASIDFSKGETNADDYGESMALQSNGKIVVVGQSYINTESGESPQNERAVVARLNANGTLDTTFGVGATDEWEPGKLVIQPEIGESGGSPGGYGDVADAVVVRPDNRIVVAGGVDEEYGEPPQGEFFALGLTAQGLRDTTFGSDGRVVLDFGARDQAQGAALAPNGDLILAGSSETGYASSDAVARLSPTGSPVAGFGSGGKELLTGVGGGELTDVAVQPDGKLVLAATEREHNASSSKAGVIRLAADGSIDNLGGVPFAAVPPTGGYDDSASVAVDSEGRLLLSSISYEAARKISFRIARFTPAGTLDTTFGSGGVVKLPVGESSSDYGFGAPYLALQPDGGIVLAGTDEARFDVRRFIGGNLALPPASPPGGTSGASGSPAAGSSGGSGPAAGGATTKPPAPGIEGLKSAVSSEHDRATFTFGAAGSTSAFQCALVKSKKKKHGAAGPSFSTCRSPKTYDGLAPGHYAFEVRAVGIGGTGAVEVKHFAIAPAKKPPRA